jgi:hypothetical protein
MADTSSIQNPQQFSSHLSRRRALARAVTLAVAGATSPAFAQSTGVETCPITSVFRIPTPCKSRQVTAMW